MNIVSHLIFLGLALGPNNTSEVVTDHPVRLTMAALDIDGRDMCIKKGFYYVLFQLKTVSHHPVELLVLQSNQVQRIKDHRLI